MAIVLSVIAGPHNGKEFIFDGHDTFLVGRARNAHFRLDSKDEYFSRLQFIVEANFPKCRLIDLGSTNGTFVNGRRATVVDLHDGDLIQGGTTTIKVRVNHEAEAPISPTYSCIPEHTPSDATNRQSSNFSADTLELFPAGPSGDARAEEQAGRICLMCKNTIPEICHQELEAQADESGPKICQICIQKAATGSQPIQGYQLIFELGRGGMGIVFLAVRGRDGSVVALKTIKPAAEARPGQVQRFLREAEILRKLEHPQIVKFRDLGESAGILYFAMDYVAGTDADRLVAHTGPLAVERTVHLILQLLDALEYAHKQGIVHRDIKPANLLVCSSGEKDRDVLRLVDFGLGRLYQTSQLSGLTLAGAVGGTLAFMPPEQLLDFHGALPASDQYSAAATFYYLLTGRFIYDFPSNVSTKLRTILETPPTPIRDHRQDIPETLAQVIERGLSKQPHHRFDSIAAFRQALKEWKPS